MADGSLSVKNAYYEKNDKIANIKESRQIAGATDTDLKIFELSDDLRKFINTPAYVGI